MDDTNNNSVSNDSNSNDEENPTLGRFQENELYQLGKIGLSVGKTRGGRHTLTFGFIHDDGKFNTRIPAYVDLKNSVEDENGIKGMNCVDSLANDIARLIREAAPQLFSETREFVASREGNKPRFVDQQVVVRAPGKTERERAKLDARKAEAKASESAATVPKKK